MKIYKGLSGTDRPLLCFGGRYLHGLALRWSPHIQSTFKMEVRKGEASELSYEQFIEEHWKPGVPLVLKNATKVWGAYGKFSPDWFREHFGDRPTHVDGTRYTMCELMDLMKVRDTSRPVPYPCKYHIPTQLPELMPMLDLLNIGFANPNWLQSSWFKRGY